MRQAALRFEALPFLAAAGSVAQLQRNGMAAGRALAQSARGRAVFSAAGFRPPKPQARRGVRRVRFLAAAP